MGELSWGAPPLWDWIVKKVKGIGKPKPPKPSK